MRSTHSQNNSGGAVPPAHVAQPSTRPEKDGVKENQACWVRGGEVPEGGGHENKDATCQSERRAIRARSTGGWVTGVRCKQEMVCLFSAPSSPACVKDAQRQKLRSKRPFPPNNVVVTQCYQLPVAAFCVFPRLDVTGIKWRDEGRGGVSNCSLSGSLQPPSARQKFAREKRKLADRGDF